MALAGTSKVTEKGHTFPLGQDTEPVPRLGRSSASNCSSLPHVTREQSSDVVSPVKQTDSDIARTSITEATDGSGANLVMARARVMSTQPWRVALVARLI